MVWGWGDLGWSQVDFSGNSKALSGGGAAPDKRVEHCSASPPLPLKNCAAFYESREASQATGIVILEIHWSADQKLLTNCPGTAD